MIISHNMPAMNASRSLKQVSLGVQKNSEKMSSGYRINRAADDAAGLTISEKLRWQARGLKRASLNAEEGISFIQTAEGALNEIHSLLQRGRELSVQAANDTNRFADRNAIVREIRALNKEIDRISTDTEFNKIKVFDSSSVAAPVKAGRDGSVAAMDEPEIIQYDIENINQVIEDARDMGKNFTPAALEKFGNQLRDDYLPKVLGNIVTALDTSAVPTVSGMKIGLKLIYEDEGGDRTAYVSSNGIGYELGINIKYLTETKGNIDMDGWYASVIAHEMTHAVMFDINTNGMLGTHGADGFPGWFIEGVAQSVGGAMNYLPNMDNDEALKEWMSHLTDASGNVYAQGYLASMYLGYKAGGGGAVSAAVIADGLDKILKDISDGYSLGQSVSRHTAYGDLKDFERKFSSDAVQFFKDLKAAAGSGNGSIISPSGLAGTPDSLLTGAASNNYFILDVDHNWVANDMGGKDPYRGGGATTTNRTDRDGNVNPDAKPVWGSKTENENTESAIMLKVGTLSGSGNGIKLSCFKLSHKDLGLDVLVNSYDNANNALASYDNAINIVSGIRSYYGAMQNRLEHTIANLDNTAENTTAAESKLRDTDMAGTMVEYSTGNILLQAGQSMLAQANRLTDGVLSLLQ